MIDTSAAATLSSLPSMTTPEQTRPDGFAAIADAQSRALSRTVCSAGAVLTVALWPFDLLVRASNPRAAHTLFAMRLELLALYAAFFGASWALGRRVGGVLLAVPPAVLATGVFGLAIGQLAREDNYWFISLYMLPMICMPLLMPLGQRIVVAALCVATPLVGFALTFHGALSAVHVAHALGLFLMAATFGVYGGEVYYRQAREAYGLRRALDDKRAELADANLHLEARVEEQTRDLRRLATRLEDVIETERRHLAGELQDDLGQELTAMRLEVETLAAVARDEPAASRVTRVAGAIERSHQSVRLILESLRPRILNEDGVEAALRWLARQFRERTGRACEARVELDEAPDVAVALAVFRIVQNALSNVARHPGVTRVDVVARGDGDRIALTITDDGPGASAHDERGQSGLIGMRERALAVGGTIDFAAVEPAGTRVSVALPTRSPG